MMKSLRLTLSPLLSIMIRLSLAPRSTIPPSVPSGTAHGAVSSVYGPGVSFSLYWLAKSSRYALPARTSPRRSSQPGIGNCRQPRPSFCTDLFFLLLAHELSSLFSRYFSIFIIYTPYTIYQCMLFPLSIKRFSYAMPIDGFKGWFKLIYKDGWKCMFLWFPGYFGEDG